MANTKGVVAFPGALDDVVSLLNTVNSVSSALLQGTLNSSITSGATTITASVSGSLGGYPTVDGSITIDDEIIYYDTAGVFAGVVTFSLCARGQDGTTAAAHSAGATVFSYALSGHRQLLRDAVIAIETKLGTGSSTATASTWLKGTGAGTSAWTALVAADITTALGNVLTLTGAGTALTVSNNAQFNNIGIGAAPNASYGFYQLGGGARIDALSRTVLTVTPTGTTGATTWSYAIFAKDRNGNYAPCTNSIMIANGNATLSGTNYNALSWTAVPGAVGYDVVRVIAGGTPATTGSIALAQAGTTLNDTGLAATAYTSPTWNTTGDLSVGGALRLGNTTSPGNAASATGDQTAPAVGSIWYNTVNKLLKGQTDFGPLGLTGHLIGSNLGVQLAGATITTTETAFACNVAIPANALVPNKILHVVLGGVWSSSASPTQIFNLRMNDGAGTIVNLMTTGTAATILSALSNQPWFIEAWLTVLTGGSAGQITSLGRITCSVSPTTFAETTLTKAMGNGGVAVNQTVAQTLELSMKLSSAGTGFVVTLDTFFVEVIN